MRQYIDLVQDVRGNALYNAVIEVLNFNTGLAATIYSDNGVTPIPSGIVTSDQTGQFSFYAPDGYYTLRFSYAGTLFKTQSPISIFAGYDARLDRSAEEISAGVTPSNFNYEVGDLRRYGGDPTGVADSSTALQRAANVGLIIVPPASSFRIVTGATRNGPIVVRGSGRSSKILCDTTWLTVNNGSYSTVDNLVTENITAPWIITRDPTNWAFNPLGTLQQSNTVLGYQPTISDSDIWSSLTSAQQNQDVGPVLAFIGNMTEIHISRIYGRFALIYLNGVTNSSVRNCDFRGGKGVFGGIVFNNSGVQVGDGNVAQDNRVYYASVNGICFLNNTHFTASGNMCYRCGESGIKTFADSEACFYGEISSNQVYDNFFDGIDANSTVAAVDTKLTYHNIVGNRCQRNGGTGMNGDGQFNNYASNHLYQNYRQGIWGNFSRSHVHGNFFVDNNIARNTAVHDLSVTGSTGLCKISGNHVYAGAGQNNFGIHAAGTHFIGENYGDASTFFFGNQGSIKSVLQNYADAFTGLLTDQSFMLDLFNNAGTLQHAIKGFFGSSNLGNYNSRINAASPNFTNTPTGTDSSTAFGAGVKIGSANPYVLYFDTAAQVDANFNGLAVVATNSTGTTLMAMAQYASININGVTRNRLVIAITTTAGAAFNLNTTNITAGNGIRLMFYGKIA